MGQQFIDKVRAIILKNISNEKFGVRDLSSQLGLSSSQILRKVKAATGKSVNQYIRELRLEKAAKLIKKTDDNIAEISYKVGFNSPSYFNKAFSKYYGIAPGEYKTKSANLSELKAAQTDTKKSNLFSNKKLVYVLSALLLVVVGYFVITAIFPKNDSLPNSIAVLPFKDLSPENTQWFSDGVSDNILHTLAQMDDVSVTSFTSSSTYRKTDKQIPEIAKELGVSYILEGSVTLVNDEIKIIAQLIDANDQHVWSKEYYDNFDNVIAMQNNVAQEVVRKLKSTLNPIEQTILKKYPTDNMEAYHLHLEGRIINQSIKRTDLLHNIEYNKRAIALDSNFVEAYAEVATTNMLLAINSIQTPFGISYLDNPLEKITEAEIYVNKALEINPNSPKANAVKARLLLDNNEEESENYFKKAIALNPSDAESRDWYANYFLTSEKRDLKKALKQATIANKLSPFSSVIAKRYAWVLILNKKYKEAELYIKNYGFMLSPVNHVIFTTNIIYRKNKNWQPVFDWALANLEEDRDNASFWNYIISWGYHMIYRNKEKAIVFAKQAYELNPYYFSDYFRRVNQYGLFKKAEHLLQTADFNALSESNQSNLLWFYYYCRKDYKQALDIIEKDPLFFGYYSVSSTYARLGDIHKLDSISKTYSLYGSYNYSNKALVHAILKERDSMYYYFDKLKYLPSANFIEISCETEFDPYRKDERFKTLLGEFYIPTSED